MEVLYKYLTAKRALACLPEVGDGTLRATQPLALNDPFECAVESLIADSEKDRLRLNEEFAQVLTEINPTTPITPEKVSQARMDYGSLYLRNLFAQQLSTKFGIISFSCDPKHPLMWSHYTKGGYGFVIGYDVSLVSSLTRLEDSLCRVKYSKTMPPRISYKTLAPTAENRYGVMCVKSDHWIYESEWRLIVELKDTIGVGKRDSMGLPVNLVRIPNESVVSVYFTERTPKDAVQKIRDRLEDPNNRYGTQHLTKLITSSTRYEYEEAPH